MTVYHEKVQEAINFCKEKYGTAYPSDIGFGEIVWIHVPVLAWGDSPYGIPNKPYLALQGYDKGEGYFIDSSKLQELSSEQLALLGIDFDPY